MDTIIFAAAFVLAVVIVLGFWLATMPARDSTPRHGAESAAWARSQDERAH